MKNVMFAIAFIATMTLVSCGGSSVETTSTTTDTTLVDSTVVDSTTTDSTCCK